MKWVLNVKPKYKSKFRNVNLDVNSDIEHVYV